MEYNNGVDIWYFNRQLKSKQFSTILYIDKETITISSFSNPDGYIEIDISDIIKQA